VLPLPNALLLTPLAVLPWPTTRCCHAAGRASWPTALLFRPLAMLPCRPRCCPTPVAELFRCRSRCCSGRCAKESTPKALLLSPPALELEPTAVLRRRRSGELAEGAAECADAVAAPPDGRGRSAGGVGDAADRDAEAGVGEGALADSNAVAAGGVAVLP